MIRKDGHMPFDEYDEHVSCGQGSYRTDSFWVNAQGISIRKYCASCVHGDDNRTKYEDRFVCRRDNAAKCDNYLCAHWEAKQVYQLAGSDQISQGKVQTKEYVAWRVMNYERLGNLYKNLYPDTAGPNRDEFVRARYIEETGKNPYYEW